MDEDAIKVELRYIRDAVEKIEQHLDKQNSRLRIVEQEQARQGVYSGLIAAGIAGAISGIWHVFSGSK